MAAVPGSSLRVLAVLAGLVLLALGALHLSRRSSPDTSRLLVPAERQPRELDGITVRLRGAAPFVLSRAETGPRLVPPGLGADPASFEALRAALAGSIALRRFAAGSASEVRARYGLAEPRAVLSWPGGPELRIGDATPDGGAYVQLGEDREVAVVDASAVEPLLAPAERYRSGALFLRPILGASRIELPRLGLVRGGDGWLVIGGEDRGQRADAAAVRALLSRLDGLRAPRFVAPLSSYGERLLELPSAAPPLRVLVDGRELLRGGWPCPGGGPGVWLHREDGEDLCMDGVSELLSVPSGALLQTRLARLEPGALRRVVREHGPACVAADAHAQSPREELVRDGGWRLASPTAVPLDRGAASSLIDALGSLRVRRWPTLEESASLLSRLAAPALRLQVEGQGGSQLIEIGCLADEGCVARADGAERLAILDGETCAALFAPLHARSLLALDEARLTEVCVVRAKGSGERCLSRSDAPVRAALRALTEAQSVEYGVAAGSPIAVVRVRHAPAPAGVPTEDAAGEVAPLVQEIRLYTSPADRGLSAVRVGRELTYRLSAESGRALGPLMDTP